MKIINTNFANARDQRLNEKANWIVGFCDVGSTDFFEDPGASCLIFNDINGSTDSEIGPEDHDMSHLRLTFWTALQINLASILIHCTGGVSRSGAATLLLLMMKNKGNIQKSLDELWEINPDVAPNEWMTAWIDKDMNLNGKLSLAVDARWVAEKLKRDPEFFS